MYDLHQSRYNYEDFDLFSLDDVDATFERITQLKYNQSLALHGKGHGLVITPMASGHIIGGTIWKINKDNDEDIIYAVDYNHKRERHLNACFVDNMKTPSLMITDCYNACYRQERRKERDEQLMTNILSTVRQGGNVLIAVDTAGRVLELAHMLDQLWRTPGSGLVAYSLAMLNTVTYNVIELAKSQMEWMSDKIMKTFEGHRNNPFNFRHLKLIHSMAELDRIREPKVVLASQPDLECGFSREVFAKWVENEKNSIILTQRSSAFTTTSKLMEITAENEQASDRFESRGKRVITLMVKERVELEGEELILHNEQQRINQEKEMLAKKMEARMNKLDSDDENDDDDDDVGFSGAANAENLLTNVPTESRKESFMQVDPRLDESVSEYKRRMKRQQLMQNSAEQYKNYVNVRKTFPMYPVLERKMKWDDFGEELNPKDFLNFADKCDNGGRPGSSATLDEPAVDGTDEMLIDEEVPTKCITRLVTININASIKFIDFEGRSDGESIKKIIQQIRPRRLILVRGNDESTNELKEFCLRSLSIDADKLLTPCINELVDATTERNIYQVRLKDSLVSSLRFAKAKDGAELCWVEAAIELEADAPLVDDDGEENNESADRSYANLPRIQGSNRELLPILRPLSTDEMGSHATIFVNELKLSDFKQVLLKNGIQAEFHGGVLYVNQKVCLRRNESGRINLEGTLCDDYFKVRKLLYSQMAII